MMATELDGGMAQSPAGLYEEARAMQEELSAWRRTLHAIPEVGLHLPSTSAFVKERLTEMGIEYTTLVDGSCVVATLGSGEGPCIMLRADFDALPIEEQSGEEFASKNGAMHACGHDMHAAMLLGAARMLKERESQLAGCVKLFFQPGEEAAHGAATCIDEGVLENPKPDVAFAAHVASQVPVGVMAWGVKALARAHNFKITVTGVGGHGSMPYMCVDPITPAASIHLGLQELLAREVKGTDEVALTIGSFRAGEASNVIPQTAELKGNMRTFDDDVHDKLYARICEMAPAIAQAYRATAEVESIEDDPMLVCDEDLSRLASDVAQAAIPGVRVLDGKLHVMGSEDFSYIAHELPSAYFMVGAKMEDGEEVFGQHHPKARFNEACLPMGAALHAGVAMAWLARQMEGERVE